MDTAASNSVFAGESRAGWKGGILYSSSPLKDAYQMPQCLPHKRESKRQARKKGSRNITQNKDFFWVRRVKLDRYLDTQPIQTLIRYAARNNHPTPEALRKSSSRSSDSPCRCWRDCANARFAR